MTRRRTITIDGATITYLGWRLGRRKRKHLEHLVRLMTAAERNQPITPHQLRSWK